MIESHALSPTDRSKDDNVEIMFTSVAGNETTLLYSSDGHIDQIDVGSMQGFEPTGIERNTFASQRVFRSQGSVKYKDDSYQQTYPQSKRMCRVRDSLEILCRSRRLEIVQQLDLLCRGVYLVVFFRSPPIIAL